MAWSAQNVDRTVSPYRAAKRAGRTLVVDLYTAEVLELLTDYGRLPQPGIDNFKVVITASMARIYKRTGRADFVDRMATGGRGISTVTLESNRSNWVVMLRDSLRRDYEKKGVTPTAQDAWSWSMWTGISRTLLLSSLAGSATVSQDTFAPAATHLPQTCVPSLPR